MVASAMKNYNFFIFLYNFLGQFFALTFLNQGKMKSGKIVVGNGSVGPAAAR